MYFFCLKEILPYPDNHNIFLLFLQVLSFALIHFKFAFA